MKILENPGRITPVQVPDLPSSQQKPEGTQEKSFGQTLKELLYTVNDKGIQANEQVDQVVRGESDDLHTAMVALEEANISFQLMLETRNKMLEAYQEINRMNI
ncbi:MAG: flagellar hook-basal body complex protein FliE [Candidatus Marinimicrobia bacterium]|nr:flagellar hook-basal body complex protein FliE [Candidatus Neomarinimicrobiota bacterium]